MRTSRHCFECEATDRQILDIFDHSLVSALFNNEKSDSTVAFPVNTIASPSQNCRRSLKLFANLSHEASKSSKNLSLKQLCSFFMGSAIEVTYWTYFQYFTNHLGWMKPLVDLTVETWCHKSLGASLQRGLPLIKVGMLLVIGLCQHPEVQQVFQYGLTSEGESTQSFQEVHHGWCRHCGQINHRQPIPDFR